MRIPPLSKFSSVASRILCTRAHICCSHCVMDLDVDLSLGPKTTLKRNGRSFCFQRSYERNLWTESGFWMNGSTFSFLEPGKTALVTGRCTIYGHHYIVYIFLHLLAQDVWHCIHMESYIPDIWIEKCAPSPPRQIDRSSTLISPLIFPISCWPLTSIASSLTTRNIPFNVQKILGNNCTSHNVCTYYYIWKNAICDFLLVECWRITRWNLK